MGKQKFKKFKTQKVRVEKPAPMSNMDLQKTMFKQNMNQEVSIENSIKLMSRSIDLLMGFVICLFSLHFGWKLALAGSIIIIIVGLFALGLTVFRIYGK